jgi:hypothetical protein
MDADDMVNAALAGFDIGEVRNAWPPFDDGNDRAILVQGDEGPAQGLCQGNRIARKRSQG